MATTSTRTDEFPNSGKKEQIWDVTIGASDTVATWATGMNNVDICNVEVDSDEDNGKVVINSDDGTEGSQLGSIHISGLANSATLRARVLGN